MRYGFLSAWRDYFESLLYRGLKGWQTPKERIILTRNGLRPLREIWWLPWRFEAQWLVWRNLYLIAQSPEPIDKPCNTKRIVVFTPGHIGDVLMTVPMLRALRNAKPKEEVVWVVGRWAKDLAERCVYVDRVEVFSPAWYQFDRSGRFDPFAAQREWGRGREPCDVFLSTASTDLSTLYVGRSCRPGRWIGRGPEVPYYRVALSEEIIRPDARLPEARDLLHLLEPLGIHADDSRLEWQVLPEDERELDALAASCGLELDKKFVVISPSAGWLGKQWPEERWAAVADFVHEMGRQVVFTGTRADKDLTDLVHKSMRGRALDLVGKTSIPVLAALLAKAEAWLGSDSGGMHLAAAVGSPTLSLFGPTNPVKWAPEGDQHRVVRMVDGCPDCIPWHPRARCQHDGACMKKIQVADVVSVLEEMLSP